jgi:hypothetical protein
MKWFFFFFFFFSSFFFLLLLSSVYDVQSSVEWSLKKDKFG